MRAPGIRQYLALLVLAALLPAIGLALALFFLSLKGEYEMAWQRASSRTTFIAAAVQTQMDALAGTLDVLAANPALTDGDLSSFHHQARTITGERVDAVSLVRPDGTTILNSRLAPDTPPPAFSVPVDDVRRALDGNLMVISDLFEGATSHQQIFAMIKPVMVAGQPHALAVGLFAHRFAPLVDRVQLPWTAALLDASGNSIAQFPRDGALPALAREQMVHALNTQTKARLSLPQTDGTTCMLSIERIPLSGWIAVSGLPHQAVEGPAFHAAFLYAAGTALLSIPSALLAFWLGWRLMRSMQALARFATDLGGAECAPSAFQGPPRNACKELDVVAERLEAAAYEIAARDAQLRDQRDVAEQRAEKIRQQTEELSRSNTELEQFAYVASHDLREPLRMVSSFLTLLERKLGEALDKDAREFMAYARDGAIRMDAMILDLLQYSRVGRMETQVEMVDMAQILANCLSDLTQRIEETGAAIHVDTPMPTVPGHPGELTRLMTNLLSNALKYRNPEVPPEIHLRANPLDGGWEISISDNGIGIDPQFHQRIFSIFQRLHTREHYEGNGIGLSICKKVVEHHKGRIWLDSELGAGATFHFTLALPPPGENKKTDA